MATTNLPLLKGDSAQLRKQRGAFFTPYEIAEFLAGWALAGQKEARVLDPTCGEGVFLLAAAERLCALGADPATLTNQLHGVDVHAASLEQTGDLLATVQAGATLVEGDFFRQSAPSQLDHELPWMDAVIGNPPFVRYQEHRRRDAKTRGGRGARARRPSLASRPRGPRFLYTRARSSSLKGASRWCCRPSCLTVGYAEPIRRWLGARFATVHLVLFDELQFADAEEQVVLLIAQGTGGCDAFALHQVRDAARACEQASVRREARHLRPPGGEMDGPSAAVERRNLFRRVTSKRSLVWNAYGRPELGTVTGANSFFT